MTCLYSFGEKPRSGDYSSRKKPKSDDYSFEKSQGDIEVAAKSLALAIASPAYPDVKFGVKLVAGNIGREKNVFTFPHFCAFLLPRFLRELDA